MPLIMQLDADARKATTKIKSASKSAGASVKQLEQQSVSSATRITSSFKNLAGVLGVTFGGALLLRGLKSTITSASDLEESINAVNVVFKEGAEAILLFGETASTSVGLAAAEFNQLATETGALLIDTGLSLGEVSDLTIELTQRAADMASVFNTDVKLALSAINQAIRGETEAIRKFAADTTDATLQTFLLSEGIDRQVTSMSQQEKKLLRIQVLMSQTKVTAGDFANTSGSLANQTRILTSRFTDIIATLGSGVIPVANSALSAIQDLFDVFTDSEFDSLVKRLNELGANVGFIQQLKVQNQINESLKRRTELTQEIKNFEQETLKSNSLFFLNQEVAIGKQVTQQQELLTQIIERTKLSKDGKEIEEFITNNLNTRIGLEAQLGRIITEQDEDLTNQKGTLELASKLLGREVEQALRLKTIMAEAFNIDEQIKKLKQTIEEGITNPFEAAARATTVWVEEVELLPPEMAKLGEEAEVVLSKFEKFPNSIKETKEETVETADAMQLAVDASGQFTQNLARALISGQNLEKTLLNAAINLGLSFLPGGSLFGRFAHGGIAPGGFVPSIVGEGGGAPEIVQSASPIRVTPLTTNNTNNNLGGVNFIFPNVKSIDRFTLENEIMPQITEIISEGGIL